MPMIQQDLYYQHPYPQEAPDQIGVEAPLATIILCHLFMVIVMLILCYIGREAIPIPRSQA